MQKKHGVMRSVDWVWAALPVTRRGWCACGGLLWAGLAQPVAPPLRVSIAVASNLKFVITVLVELYWQETGVQVEVNAGASGNLARQIAQGLPVAQFISADEAWVAHLDKAGHTLDAGQRYATGRLALVVPKNSALPLRQGLAAVVRALQAGDKFALANPAIAPYGLAAEQALQRAGALLRPQQKVLGDSASQTTQFVATGAAQAGITALALANAPGLVERLQVLPLPESLHAPLHQRMVLLKGAGPAAVAWHRFLLGPKAQAVFVRHGYALPQ